MGLSLNSWQERIFFLSLAMWASILREKDPNEGPGISCSSTDRETIEPFALSKANSKEYSIAVKGIVRSFAWIPLGRIRNSDPLKWIR